MECHKGLDHCSIANQKAYNVLLRSVLFGKPRVSAAGSSETVSLHHSQVTRTWPTDLFDLRGLWHVENKTLCGYSTLNTAAHQGDIAVPRL